MGDGRTSAGERFEIRPGALVVAGEDEVGRVERVVVRPGSGEVTGLVVRKGLLLRRDVVIPIEAVVDATEELVRLRLTSDELNALPEYREEEYVSPAADWRSPVGRGPAGVLFRVGGPLIGRGLRPARAGQTEPAAGGRPLRAGQRVVCRDGEVGPLDLVLLDPDSRRVTHFVVRRGGLLGRDTIVPVEWVREITRDQVVLDVYRGQLEQLPAYRPDEEITDDVLEALWDHSDLPPGELQLVGVRTRDGVVELDGHTLTEGAKATIEAVARSVPGVLGVRNRLQSLDALAAAVVPSRRVGRRRRTGGRKG
jgi:uncharacterized protein YrrD